MVNLAALKTNSKDKPKIPIIREKSTPNAATAVRRGTLSATTRSSLDEKYRKAMKNRGQEELFPHDDDHRE